MIQKFARAALFAGAALGLATAAGATHSWNNYHWATNGASLPLTVNLAITSQWTPSVNKAIGDWTGHFPLALVAQPSSAGARRCSPIVGQVLVCNYAYGLRGWLGIASINLDGASHITSGTTKLNDSYFNTATYNKGEWRSLVACQEIGHDFGLGHQNEIFGDQNLGTCMDYTNAPLGGVVGGFDYGLLQNIQPNTHDYNELAIIYKHADFAAAATNFGIRGVGAKPPQGFVPVEIGDTRASWGVAVHRDGKGRADRFLLSVGGGRKIATHVFWASDATGHEAD